MNRKFLIAGLAILLLSAAGGALYTHRQSGDDSMLVLHGNVDLRQVSLAFKGSDRIASLAVQEGEWVHNGQVLGQLDLRELNLRLRQAQAQADAQQQQLQRLQAGSRPEEIAQAHANLAAAQSEAELARQQLERLQNVHRESGGHAVSPQDLDAAQARRKTALAQVDNTSKALQLTQKGPRQEDIAQAKALLEAAQAGVALLQQQLDDATLRAPIDAVVRARLMEPGDMTSPQKPVYTLAIAHPKWVRAYVQEADLGRIRPGMAADISIDSAPGRKIQGRIGYISGVAEFTPKTVQTEELRSSLVYEVRIMASDGADQLRLGMPATVHLDLRQTAPAKK